MRKYLFTGLLAILTACGTANPVDLNPIVYEPAVNEEIAFEPENDEAGIKEDDVPITEETQQKSENIPENWELAVVTRVIDGDTLEVAQDGETHRVRLIGIDTPERGEAGFEEASEFMLNTLAYFENTVWLESSGEDEDRFGRLRRYVWLDGETSLNQLMLDEGHATLWGSRPEPIEEESLEIEEAPKVEEGLAVGDVGPNGGEIRDSGREYFRGVPLIPEAPLRFQNCTAVREWYPTGLPAEHPAFRPAHDRDNDGWGCD
ncbi:MAG: thermonuclease family protein [Turicibacter sp.]|nr:thermonuclease family protein [Turicibacter sp.]